MSFLKRYKSALKSKGLEFVEKAVEESKKYPQQKPKELPLTKKERVGLFFFFLIFLLVGSLLMYFTYSWILNGIESKNWPAVEGTILSSEFVSSRNSDNKPSYSAEILYEYYIDNEKYLSNSITSSSGQSSSSSPGSAQRLVNEYTVPDKVKVYYNPKNPELSVLEPGFHPIDALPFSMGFVFALVGLIGVISTFLGKGKKVKKEYHF
ncbi:MAG: DUF3592 domain-containing protein [Nanoarchaeota archaeon]